MKTLNKIRFKRLIVKNIISFLFIGGLLQGCSLTEEPKTFISPDAYFDGYDSYEAAVQGIYSSIAGMPGGPVDMFGNDCMMIFEMFSDICREPDASYEQALPTYQNDRRPIFYNTRRFWQSAYTIIKNANFVLSKMPSSPEYTSLAAEARFLRAYAYFYLVQVYGDIPLRKVPVESYKDMQIPRTNQETVYEFILEDLTFAENNLKNKAPQNGRVYQSVATALLAKVYLTMAGNPLNKKEYYTMARDKAVSVINSGHFTLMDDYADVFHNTAYTSESIWEQLYDPQKGASSSSSMISITITATGFKPILLPAEWFIGSFTEGDRRGEWGIVQNYKDPSGKILPSYFRKFVDNSIIDNNIAPGSVIANYTRPYLRLAEMYLIAAEAENEINGPQQAYQYINKIRWRARTDKSNPALVPDFEGMTKEELRNAIYMERKKELHLERSTWIDLKRTNTFNRIQETRPGSLVNPIGIYNQTWPIPDEELISNKIEQNPMP